LTGGQLNLPHGNQKQEKNKEKNFKNDLLRSRGSRNACRAQRAEEGRN